MIPDDLPVDADGVVPVSVIVEEEPKERRTTLRVPIILFVPYRIRKGGAA
jgi:hypothetical protein